MKLIDNFFKFSEDRKFLSEPSRALEFAVSIRRNARAALQTGWTILPRRSRNHDLAHSDQQVNCRSDRQVEPDDDDGQRREGEDHGRTLVRRSSGQIFGLGRFLFASH